MSLTLKDIYNLLAAHDPVLLKKEMFPELAATLTYLELAELQIRRDAAPTMADGKVTLNGKADVLGSRVSPRISK
jgi:hypothetical protein